MSTPVGLASIEWVVARRYRTITDEKFPSIPRVANAPDGLLEEGHLWLLEKLDGANFRFQLQPSGLILFGDRSRVYENPEPRSGSISRDGRRSRCLCVTEATLTFSTTSLLLTKVDESVRRSERPVSTLHEYSLGMITDLHHMGQIVDDFENALSMYRDLLAVSPYHVAYTVSDVHVAVERFEDAGWNMYTPEPEHGLGPYLRAFADPKATPGIPFEFIELADTTDS